MFGVQSVGLTPETRHANWLLLAEAFYVSVNSAMTPLTEMGQGKWGPACRPNTDSYNCILRVGLAWSLDDEGRLVAPAYMMHSRSGQMPITSIELRLDETWLVGNTDEDYAVVRCLCHSAGVALSQGFQSYASPTLMQ
jgi:hypothetical protein